MALSILLIVLHVHVATVNVCAPSCMQDSIRLRYRISWMQEGVESVETGEVANFPAI